MSSQNISDEQAEGAGHQTGEAEKPQPDALDIALKSTKDESGKRDKPHQKLLWFLLQTEFNNEIPGDEKASIYEAMLELGRNELSCAEMTEMIVKLLMHTRNIVRDKDYERIRATTPLLRELHGILSAPASDTQAGSRKGWLEAKRKYHLARLDECTQEELSLRKEEDCDDSPPQTEEDDRTDAERTVDEWLERSAKMDPKETRLQMAAMIIDESAISDTEVKGLFILATELKASINLAVERVYRRAGLRPPNSEQEGGNEDAA
ncbi:MAG TPA: hypothetical protein VNI02_17455 [Blastocatellia bacterium]|jgi:hypothetical protein|nr:hypothetical protein [Blastocatellia bacterium]